MRFADHARDPIIAGRAASRALIGRAALVLDTR
jgi:hypothetical protein